MGPDDYERIDSLVEKLDGVVEKLNDTRNDLGIYVTRLEESKVSEKDCETRRSATDTRIRKIEHILVAILVLIVGLQGVGLVL